MPAEAAGHFVVAAIAVRDAAGRVLVVRKRGTERFMLPGGKIESGESPVDTAARELREETGIDLPTAALSFLGTWTAPAANEPGHTVEGHVFACAWVGDVMPLAEIEAAQWCSLDELRERGDLAPLLRTCVLPVLA